MAQNAQASINIPQLIAVALVGFLAIRWYLSKPSADGSNTRNASISSRTRPIDMSKIEQVSAMFPQLDRREIAWDLDRNGGSVAATTERLLSGRALDSPPPAFQPDLPVAASATSSLSPAAKRGGADRHPDLITRYGLHTRITGKGKEAIQEQQPARQAWSSDKTARAESLKKRREEMVLAARRKMQQASQERFEG